MKLRSKLGVWALAGMLAMMLPVCAAAGSQAAPQQHPGRNPSPPPPVHTQTNRSPRAERPAGPQQHQEKRQERQERKQEKRDDRPPNAGNGGANAQGKRDENRPPNATPPGRQNFRDLSPQEQQRVIQNEKRFNQMSPQQRAEMQRRGEVWQKLTPEQRDHLRNDVIPKWKQMPPERRQAIQQRLRILQNMPESARKQRLSDPNFTRGMSEEDKATLHDLSHLHVGGAPEPPSE